MIDLKRIQLGILLSVACVVVGGCAVGQKLIPINDPTQRFSSKGFSVLPPRGEKWFFSSFLAEQIKMESPGPIGGIVFSKILTEKIMEGHSIVATALTWNYGELFSKEKDRTKERFVPLDVKVSLDRYLGRECVRYSSVVEDHAPRDRPGTVFVLAERGFYFLHPFSSSLVVQVNYSQRFLPGGKPVFIESEVEPFLRSLIFAPVPSLGTRQLNSQERKELLKRLASLYRRWGEKVQPEEARKGR